MTDQRTLGSETAIERDVVVVGAGPAGLMAARTLVAAGRTVAVLEARDRVGGRTWSKTVDGAFLEIGGQWISPDQTELLALVDELGLQTFQRYREGESVYLAPDGTRHTYTGSMFPAGESTTAEMEKLVALLDGDAALPGQGVVSETLNLQAQNRGVPTWLTPVAEVVSGWRADIEADVFPSTLTRVRKRSTSSWVGVTPTSAVSSRCGRPNGVAGSRPPSRAARAVRRPTRDAAARTSSTCSCPSASASRPACASSASPCGLSDPRTKTTKPRRTPRSVVAALRPGMIVSANAWSVASSAATAA